MDSPGRQYLNQRQMLIGLSAQKRRDIEQIF